MRLFRVLFSALVRRTAFVAFASILVIILSTVALAAPSAYLFTGSEQWGTVDLSTGVFTQLGNTGLLLSGIGSAGGNVYGGQFAASTLYQINVANGITTSIGNGSLSYGDTGSTSTSLYGFGRDSNLYSINASTGVSTLLGPTGISYGHVVGMSAGPGGLYVAMDYGAGSQLYLLNTTNGSSTLLGNTGVNDIGAMVWIGGTLYAGTTGSATVWTLDTTTGVGTFVTNASGISGGFWGLAPISSPTPEPSSLVLLGSGLVGVVGAVRRKLAVK